MILARLRRCVVVVGFAIAFLTLLILSSSSSSHSISLFDELPLEPLEDEAALLDEILDDEVSDDVLDDTLDDILDDVLDDVLDAALDAELDAVLNAVLDDVLLACNSLRICLELPTRNNGEVRQDTHEYIASPSSSLFFLKTTTRMTVNRSIPAFCT